MPALEIQHLNQEDLNSVAVSFPSLSFTYTHPLKDTVLKNVICMLPFGTTESTDKLREYRNPG